MGFREMYEVMNVLGLKKKNKPKKIPELAIPITELIKLAKQANIQTVQYFGTSFVVPDMTPREQFFFKSGFNAGLNAAKEEAKKWIKAMEDIIFDYEERFDGKLNIKQVTKKLRQLGYYGWYTKDAPLKYADESIIQESFGAIEWIIMFFDIPEFDFELSIRLR